jgi:hypothetical protein
MHKHRGVVGFVHNLIERSACAALGHRASWWLGVSLGYSSAVCERCGRRL